MADILPHSMKKANELLSVFEVEMKNLLNNEVVK